ncbi:MAG: OmpA family protein [Vibrio sp.]|uniref:OmpA family protein n=1 Tax=Vibrio sp. TaxID=678 RepID=UPI003A84A380
MKKHCILVPLLFSSAVLAQNDDVYPHLFIGAKGGYFMPDADFASDTFGPGANVGVSFTEHWSWDIGYQYVGDTSPYNISSEAGYLESALRYDWYFLDETSLYSRLGAAYWMVDLSSTERPYKENGLSPLAEIGINHRITPHVYVNLGYKFISDFGNSSVGEYNLHGISADIAYHFKGKRHEDVVVTPVKVEEPTVIAPEYRIYGTYINELGFDFDSSVVHVTPELNTIFAEWKRVIRLYPQAEVSIVGHTDSIGSDEYNMALSLRRAHAVVDALGLPEAERSRIRVSGKGETDPVATNNTAIGRAQNRRVELIIWSFEYEAK